MLTLKVTKKDFLLLKEGTKKFDFRPPSKFNKQLLLRKEQLPGGGFQWTTNHDIKEILFVNGNSPNSPSLVAEISEISAVTFSRDIKIPEGNYMGYEGTWAIRIDIAAVKNIK